MKRRFGVCVIAAILTWGCASDKAGVITDPPRDGVTPVKPQFVLAGDLVISDIQIVDLGTLPGGATSSASDINDAGDIVGSSETMSGQTHGFILIGSVKTDLGTLPGGNASFANGLNNLRQVVGSAKNSAGVSHGFMWQSGLMRDLGAFPPEDNIGSQSFANAINDAGLIAGSVDLAGVVWDLAGVPKFPPFPPNVRVTDPGPFSPAQTHDINNAGQAAGTSLGFSSAFRWQAGTMTFLPSLTPQDDDAFGINGLGQVVGRALLAPPVHYHAVLWPNPTTVVDLGTLGGTNSAAQGINNDGLVVGSSETASGDTRAFVWRANLGMQALGTLGGSYSAASAINASGQIVGTSSTSTGALHAALWTIKFATAIAIDVKPGSTPNSVNPRSHGVIPVAILTTDDLDATTVNPQSVRFGPNKAVEAHGRSHIEDVNGDGRPDVVFHFRTDETGIQCGDTTVILKGETFGGDAVQGTDSIRTVGCK
jgi:probable HAF family extracellular repeat protein